jgi:predicted RNA binding protein YcfA (HicA-like mRNA interferase family)
VSQGLPLISGKAAVQALERAGFVAAGTRGSHQKLRNPEGRVVIIPIHRELKRGTLASILRQAGLTTEEFRALL